MPHVLIEFDPPLPNAPDCPGDTSDLVYFLSFACAGRFGGSHELAMASLLLKGEYKVDLKPLFTFADREIEDPDDAEALELARQEAAPLAAPREAIVRAI